MSEVRNKFTPIERVTVDFTEAVGRTKQQFKDECDINNIVNKYQRTGAIAHANAHQANYDYATSLSFYEAMNIVTTGETMFNDLPSSLRRRFENDPAKFLDFVQNEDNTDEMIELGLATPLPPEPVGPVPPIAEKGAEGAASEPEASETPTEAPAVPPSG